MPASLQKFSDNRKINPNSERPIQCPYCPQKYLLGWDDREWNSVKDWIRGGRKQPLFFLLVPNNIRGRLESVAIFNRCQDGRDLVCHFTRAHFVRNRGGADGHAMAVLQPLRKSR
jgi:hypothetical protein